MGRVMDELDPRLMEQIEKDGVGPFLRRLREEKEIPLRSISEKTRIRTYYLESIETGDFDKLPAGPVGLGFIRAFADAVGVDSTTVAASYKQEIAGGVPLEAYELEPEVQTRFSPVSGVNRFSSVATIAFVLIFLVAGGGLLWFMKGRTEQLVPIGSIVGRIRTAVAPVADKIPLLNGASEKAKNEVGAGKETDVVEGKAPEEGRPPASTVNLKEPPVSEKAEKPSSAQEEPAVQASAPARENRVAEEPPPVRDASVTQESPPAQAQESPPVQVSAQVEEAPVAREEPSSREGPPATQNPATQAGIPASPDASSQASASTEQKVALNTPSNAQAAPQGQQAPAAPAEETPAPAASEELPLSLKIFATEDTWLRIVVDAKNTEELLLLAGKERNWKASEKFALTVGNIAGTQVSLNGAEVALPKKSSNVLRDFMITKKYLN